MPGTVVDCCCAGSSNKIARAVSNKEICVMICGVNVERNVGLAAKASFIPESKDELLGRRTRVDPRVDGKVIRSHNEVAVARASDKNGTASVETESLRHLACRIGFGSLPCAIASANDIIRISVA